MALADRVAASYRRAFERVGFIAAIRRYSGTGYNAGYSDYSAKARIVGGSAAQLSGSVVQTEHRVIMSAADLVASGLSLPVTTADNVMMGTKELAIKSVDDKTRRVGETLIAYDLQVSG